LKLIMRENRLTIKINKSAKEVYAFYINPKNTPLWVKTIVYEETNQWPIGIGTIYKNKNKEGKWTEYQVVALKENELYELVSKDGNYHVRYTHHPINEHSSELEYYEWVDKGELEEPFTLEILKVLKQLLEK